MQLARPETAASAAPLRARAPGAPGESESSALERRALGTILRRLPIDLREDLEVLPSSDARVRETWASHVVRPAPDLLGTAAGDAATQQAVHALLELPNSVLALVPKEIYVTLDLANVPEFAKRDLGHTDGVYSHVKDIAAVEVDAQGALKKDRRIIYHEIGHALENRLLGFSPQKAPPTGFLQALAGDLQSGAGHPDLGIRRLLDHPHEAFADSFALYQTEPERLRRESPNVWRYWDERPIQQDWGALEAREAVRR